MNRSTKDKARAAAGFRERFAMENGKQSQRYINGHLCYIFTYSSDIDYQDANGATFDTVLSRWID